MRNSKKLLAMFLALVMMIVMVTVPISSAVDETESTYVEETVEDTSSSNDVVDLIDSVGGIISAVDSANQSYIDNIFKIVKFVLNILIALFNKFCGSSSEEAPEVEDPEDPEDTTPSLDPTVYPEVEDLDTADVDVEIYSFESNINKIEVDTIEEVTFTAEVFANVEIESNVVVYDGESNVVGYMNDDATDGDETADDGVYTLVTEISSDEAETVNYYAVIGNVTSEAIGFIYYVLPSQEVLEVVETVDARIVALLQSEEYIAKTEAEQIQAVSDLLDELKAEELISEISYDSSSMTYNFSYSTGALGQVVLEEVASNELSYASSTDANGVVSYSTDDVADSTMLNAIVLTALDDIETRDEFYVDLETSLEASDINTVIDNDVTVEDLLSLSDYDIVILSMHGNYNADLDEYSLVIYQPESIEAYNYEIHVAGTIKTFIDGEGEKYLLITQDFFDDNYSYNTLDNKMVYVESCMFYGTDEDEDAVNYEFAQTFLESGAEVVFGYHNSVFEQYSSEMMSYIVEAVATGSTAAQALADAKNEYGETDTHEENPAYAVLVGNEDFTFEQGSVVGNVLNVRNETAVVGALVRIYQDGELVALTRTNSSGYYAFPSLASGDYIIEIKAGSYRSVRIAVSVDYNQTTYNATTLLMLVSDIVSDTVANGIVVNALTGENEDDVTINLRNGWNNQDGEILYTTTSNSNGYYEISYEAGTYTVEVSKDGFVTNYKNIVIGVEDLSDQDITITPSLEEGTYRIVLTWGTNPADLDSHVVGNYSTGTSFHVYYSDKTAYESGSLVCELDVDDTTSYGPETITLNPVSDEPYYYYIYRFSGSGSIATSSAQINVFNGDELVATFNAPTNLGTSDYWNVFAIVEGQIVVANTITSYADTSYAN